MKRVLIAVAVMLAAFAAVAEEPTVTNKDFKSKVFEVHNQRPSDIIGTLKLLGSGFPGSGMSINQELRTITVRDFPENIATIEEAIKRLDKPAAPALTAELKISVLMASKSPATSGLLPDELAPVVKELQSTLRYSSYTLLTTNVHRASSGRSIEASGVFDPAVTGGGDATKDAAAMFYSYTLDGLQLSGGDRPTMVADQFRFGTRFPMIVGSSTQYQDVGFKTPVTVRDGEKVVIGTTTMGDRALIVVVNAKFAK